VSTLCAFWLEHLFYQEGITTLRISIFTTKGTKITKTDKLIVRGLDSSFPCSYVGMQTWFRVELRMHSHRGRWEREESFFHHRLTQINTDSKM